MQMQEQPLGNDYIVVFEYTDAAGAYRGVRTQSHFASKEEFDAMFPPSERIEEVVVEEGVTPLRAKELLRGMAIGAFVRANVFEATDPVTGKVDPGTFETRTRMVAFALRQLWGL